MRWLMAVNRPVALWQVLVLNVLDGDLQPAGGALHGEAAGIQARKLGIPADAHVLRSGRDWWRWLLLRGAVDLPDREPALRRSREAGG